MNELYKHQQEGLEFLRKNQGGFLAYDMGTGKTRIVLEYFKEWHARGCKLLIVCPLSLVETAWRDDIKKFTPEFKMCNMHKKQRFPADIYVTNYEALISKKRFAELLDMVKAGDFLCCADESSRASNPKAITTRNLLLLKDHFRSRICLSGTPCSQSDIQWWPQITFLKSGILHESFYGFKNTYFHLQRGRAVLPLGGQTKDIYSNLFSKGWKLSITPDRRSRLFDRLRSIVIWRDIDSCLDLPPEVDEFRKVEMEEDQARAYKQMKAACVAEISGHAIIAQVALTKLMKLRQITSGFAHSPDGNAIRLPVNPKLNELKELLEELGNEQAIIFVNFKAEVADIKSVLGEEAVVLDGDTHDKAGTIEAFRNGKSRYLIANLQSVAHGITLVNTRYCVYYSHSYSAEDFTQSRARIRRIGQTRTCVYIHLQCEGTIDEIIYEVLKRKGDAVEMVAEALK
jgi:SNF2 family DNA or RNA helicase